MPAQSESRLSRFVAVSGARRPTRRGRRAGETLPRLSFGPATEKYRELGTVANLLVFNRFDALPTRNFQGTHFDGASWSARRSWNWAGVSPGRRVPVHDRLRAHLRLAAGTSGVRLEYESLYALGPMCGVDDPEAVCQARAGLRRGDRHDHHRGDHRISDAVLRRGLARPPRAFGPAALLLGDGAAVREAIDAPRGARASWRAARAWQQAGGGADQAMHPPRAACQRLELFGYDPRALHDAAGAFRRDAGADQATARGRMKPTSRRH